MGISSELIMPIKRQQETMSQSKILWEWGKECPDTKLCSWETVWNLIDGFLYRNGFFKVHPIASLPVHGELALLNVTSSPLPHNNSKILWEWGKECPDTKLCSWETVWNLIDGFLYRNGFFKVHPIASLPVHGELALLNVTSSPLPNNKPNYCTFNSLSLFWSAESVQWIFEISAWDVI